MGRGACRDGQELTFTDATGWQACNESLHQFMSKALLLPLRVTEAKVSQRQQASREDVNSDLCDFKAHILSFTHGRTEGEKAKQQEKLPCDVWQHILAGKEEQMRKHTDTRPLQEALF